MTQNYRRRTPKNTSEDHNRVAQDVDPAGRTDAGCSLDVEVGTCATDCERRACLAALRSFAAAATRLKPVNQRTPVALKDQ
jgi:hypothetical protein